MNTVKHAVVQPEVWSLWLLSRLLKATAIVIGLSAGLAALGLFISGTLVADLLDTPQERTSAIHLNQAKRFPRR